MFKYINMPKLVAFYLREFSVKASGEPSALYKFVFCLCLPFVSTAFRKARLAALAIAECTVSADQIARVLNAITGASVTSISSDTEYMVSYDGTGETAANGFNYNGVDEQSLVPYGDPVSTAIINVRLNGASRYEVEKYLALLIPFYVTPIIKYIN